MSPLWIGLLVVVLIYIIYRLLSYYFSPKTGSRIGKEQNDLSKLTQIISSEELNNGWTSTSGSTLIFYILPSIKDRTAVSGNEYATVVQIGSKQKFKLLVAADAGRNDSMAPAILEVYVKGSSTPDLIEIQNFPLQKWTAVAIVKQGRKFNIYLNGKLTVSHMCTAMPQFDDTQPLRTGDPRLEGVIALMSLDPYALQVETIQSLVDGTVDTNGMPYISSGSSFPVPTLADLTGMVTCVGDNCTIPMQASPMEQWTSPYA